MTTTLELVPSPLEAPSEAARQWAPVLKALGDPVRLEIALMLAHRPHTVKELQDALNHSQALVSHHLRLLREQGIVTSNPRGRSNVYEICTGPLACLAQCLAMMVGPGEQGCDCPSPAPSPG